MGCGSSKGDVAPAPVDPTAPSAAAVTCELVGALLPASPLYGKDVITDWWEDACRIE